MSLLSKLKNLITRMVKHLERQPPFKFILIMTGYNLIIDCIILPFFFVSMFLGIEHQFPDINPRRLFILSITISPILETLLAQMVPILIARRFIKSSWIILTISAVVFAIPHSTLDISRFIPSFLSGLLLAFTFLHWLSLSVGKAYWTTCAVHFLHNVVITSPFLFMKTGIT